MIRRSSSGLHGIHGRETCVNCRMLPAMWLHLRRAILNALAEAGGNRRMAAEKLDIGVATLHRKIKKYNI